MNGIDRMKQYKNSAIVTHRAVNYAGRFLQHETVTFTDERNRSRNWEAVNRANSFGAAVIMARIFPEREILLVRQFRPPTGRYVIEFPAGLIDKGEGPAATAERELYEETGYTGKVVEVSEAVYSSPGMSGEKRFYVAMEIDGKQYPSEPEPHQEDSESIEVLRVSEKNLGQFIQERVTAGDGIDAKLVMAEMFFRLSRKERL